MDDLGFRIELKDNGAGFPVAWLIADSGVKRVATAEEAVLWRALADARSPPQPPEPHPPESHPKAPAKKK